MKKLIQVLVLAVVATGFTSSASADLKCNDGEPLSQKESSPCRIGPGEHNKQDITGETVDATGVDLIIESGGRLYTDHKKYGFSPSARINLDNAELIVRSGGAMHGNFNISSLNLKVEDGGVIDATGLGWQAAADHKESCYNTTSDGLCVGAGPRGGVSGGVNGNSNRGVGGGGHAGKGGGYENSAYSASGGGYGSIFTDPYGTVQNPTTFGSGGGAYRSTHYLNRDDERDLSTITGHGSSVPDSGTETYNEAVRNTGNQDDPNNNLLDSDYWIDSSTSNDEYRYENPNDIRMGSGGGRLKITVKNTLNNSGVIISNGLDGSGDISNSGTAPAGGAGGSVWIRAGGISGEGEIRADGGEYTEFIDRKGADVCMGGGGGGYVYYSFSVENNPDWTVSAEEGAGTIGVAPTFGGNSYCGEGGNERFDEVATNGSVESDILFATFLNQSIVNPGEEVFLNGTASVDVRVNSSSPDGPIELPGSPLDPNETLGGEFDGTVNVLDESQFNNFGNFTLSAISAIGQKDKVLDFEYSIRTIDIDQSSEYILRPGETLEVNSDIEKIKEDGQGGSERVNYSDKKYNFSFFEGGSISESKNKNTSDSGKFVYTRSIFGTEEKKYYSTQVTNENGITGFDRKNLSWVQINDTIVDPGQMIKVNGTSYGAVNLTLESPNDKDLKRASLEFNENGGYFSKAIQSLNRSEIDEASDIGNYTLTFRTKLNGEIRTEEFEISHREIEIDNNPDFFLKAEENLDFSNFTELIKQDDDGGFERAGYDSENISFNYFNQSSNKNSTNVTTNSSGGYSIFHDLQPTPGLKRFTLETENQNGIDDTINDNDFNNINNRSLAWIDINDSIVDPGQQIQINGSAHNDVTVELEKPDGSYEPRDTISPTGTGFFEEDIQVLNRSIIEDYQDLGNYTLRLNTSLNDQVRTERFELSYREVEFFHSTDYLLRPSEKFIVDGEATISRGNGIANASYNSAEYSDATDEPGLDFEYRFFTGSGDVSKTPSINETGGFNISNQMRDVKGNKSYLIEHENNNGINYLEDDNDLNNNSRERLGLVSIDDFIVNPGEKIDVEGTAYNTVSVSIGDDVEQLDRNKTNGFFETEYKVPDFEDTQDFGNRTLFVNTTLNGKERSEAFNIGIRGLRINFDQGTVKEVDPGEEFDISGNVTKFVDDGTGGAKEVSYNGTLTAKYFGEDGLIEEKTYDISENLRDGDFEITGFKSPEIAGNRRLVVQTTNENGITRSKKQAVRTNILLESSETVSPAKRLFKDSNLRQTRFVNPDQNVTFNLQTARSIDYINNVTARVETPTGSIRTVELNTDIFTGTEIKNFQDFQSGNLNNITTRRGEDRNTDNISLGFRNTFREDTLLHMPMENPDSLADVSPNRFTADITEGSVDGAEGVFSTNATFMDGNQKIKIGNESLNVEPGNEFTLMAWIKPDTKAGFRHTIYSRKDGGQTNLELKLGNDNGNIVSRYGSDQITADSKVTYGEWQHVAVTLDNDTSPNRIRIFVNGEKVKEGDLSTDPVPVSVGGGSFIGSDKPSAPSKFKGSLDELALIDRQVTSDRISEVVSKKGRFKSDDINLENEIFDELNLINLERTLNGQNISAKIISDPDNDGTYEESSKGATIGSSTDILPVEGLETPTKDIKLVANLSSENYTESPILERIDVKTRLSNKLTWAAQRQISSFFEQDNNLGFYNVTYFAEDFENNQEETQIETSNFTVRDLRVNSPQERQVSPGQVIDLQGSVTLLKRGDSGGIERSNYTGNISAFYSGKVRGDRKIQENFSFNRLSNQEEVRIPVNGTKPPEDTEARFEGFYGDVRRSITWNSSADWNPNNRFGMLTGNIESSPKNGRSIRLGYPIRDETEESATNSLTDYYSFDDSSSPFNNSVSLENLEVEQKSPEIADKGLLSSGAASFSQGDVLAANPLGTEDAFTVQFWVRPEDVSSKQRMVSFSDKINISILPGGTVAMNTTLGDTDVVTQNQVNAGQWKNVYFSFEGDTGIRRGVGDAFAPSETISGSEVSLPRSTKIGSESFSGQIDEFRLYNESRSHTNLRDYSGLPSERSGGATTPFIETFEKEFPEEVRPGSLFLETDAEVNGQVLNISVIDGNNNPSGDIKINKQRTIYEIPRTEGMDKSKNYSIKVEMRTEDATRTPILREVKLRQRGTTSNPALNLASNPENNSEVNGRIIGGESKSKSLSGLKTGINTGEVLVDGDTGLNVRFDEVLAEQEDTEPEINVNQSGKFETSFTVPGASGINNVRYYVTTENGVGGFNSTRAVSNLKITSEDVADPVNGVEVFDYSPPNKVKFNATLAETGSVEVERVYANITTPEGNYRKVDLSKESPTLWNTTNSTSYFFDSEGVYSAEFNAISASGITELNAPEVKFNVTNATVTSELSDQTVGEGRNFTVSGKLRQNLSDELHGGEVNITLDGDTRTFPVDGGEYSAELEAPETKGNYDLGVEAETDEGIKAFNTTQIEVENSTTVTLHPEVGVDSPAEALGVSLNDNSVTNISLVLNNTGNTEARNIEVYTENLPKVNNNNNLLGDFGATDWSSINRSYNVSAGNKRTVNATVNISQASQTGTYDINVSLLFQTSGGSTRTDGQSLDIRVRENRIPAFSKDISITRESGFTGNFIPPGDEINLTLRNIGTAVVEEAGWFFQNNRFNKWINVGNSSGFTIEDEDEDPVVYPDDNGTLTFPKGGTEGFAGFRAINGKIPNGTPPGSYSTKIVPFSEDSTEVVDSTFEVEVEDTPEWRPVVKPSKPGINVTKETNLLKTLDSDNVTSPINVTKFNLGQKENLFNITLKNTGNRNLSFETNSTTGIGGLVGERGIIYQNRSLTPTGDYFRSSHKSRIIPEENYEYRFNNGEVNVGYQLSFQAPDSGAYTENLTIFCSAEGSGETCSPDKITIPITGRIQDPPPELDDVSINGEPVPPTEKTDVVLGRNQTFTVSGKVSDNDGETDVVLVTLKKYLDNQTVTETRSIKKNELSGDFGRTFEPSFKASKEGDGNYSNDHNFEVILKANDTSGNTNIRNLGNITVRDKSRLNLNLEDNSLRFDDIRSSSGDTVTLDGTINNTKIPVSNVTLNVNLTSDGQPTDKVNLSKDPENGTVKVKDQTIGPGEDLSFSYDIESAKGVSDEFNADVSVDYKNEPTGTNGSTLEIPVDVNSAPNIILNAEFSSPTKEVKHGSSKTANLKISAPGNQPIVGPQLSFIGESEQVSMRVDEDDVPPQVQSGDQAEIPVTVSVAEHAYPSLGEKDLDVKVEGSGQVGFANLTVEVPEDNAVSFNPRFQETNTPINSGDLNITKVDVENVGNQPLTNVGVTNPSTDIAKAVFVGEKDEPAQVDGLEAGDTTSIQVKSATDNVLEPKTANYTIGGGVSVNNIEQKAKIEVTFQDIGFEIESINKTEDIVAGDVISTEFNLTTNDQPVPEGNDVEIRLEVLDKTVQINPEYNSSTGLWEGTYKAPDVLDGINHTYNYQASSNAFQSNVTTEEDVKYLDVSPPTFESVSAESVLQDNKSTITVVLRDQSNISDGGVEAKISKPGSSTFADVLELEPENPDGEGLNTRITRTWRTNYTGTSGKGSYQVEVNASDKKGNKRRSELEVFRVFEPLVIEGDSGDPVVNETEIRLVDSSGDTSDTVNPKNGSYDGQQVKSGEYPEVEIEVTDDKIAELGSLEASKIDQSPPKFDSVIEEDLVNVDKEYLKGFALVSETFENVSGRILFDYSDQANQIDFQGNLQVMKCGDYNVTAVPRCQSDYNAIDNNDTLVDPSANTLAAKDISGFSSYILVEDETSSENNNLNVNLSGELGNLSSLSELSDLDSLLQQVADNTQDIEGGGGGDSGGGGGPGLSDEASESLEEAGDSLENISSQLNDSESEDLSIGNSKISVSLQPGQQTSTGISVQNPKSEEITLEIEPTPNIAEMLSLENEINLDPGEFRTVRISVNSSNKTELREYSGFLRINGEETDRTVPVNIKITSAENRLLDVTLDPTVDNFQPGKTARLKLSFSNQGFSRAVDAETTVEIVDITDDEVIAKKTQTYAVQTTLDRVVSLQIPEDTELGTYEARASVEYSNIPGNRSATAVGQVQVERPFWERKTLGLANTYWLLLFFMGVVASSGGAYWYYRKKKLEAKRSRFEEQVDNDALPSEAGRTAFIGELSEIGTRSFIDLNDLMTHCLTAGATGAGKSVAAQVIVEEALEQQVNVIVLDPTGQWSGYLDENENDEFFAFYDDFGMKESDARNYQGNIRAVDADQDTIDITDIMRPEGDEGSIHVFSMHKLENAELEEYLSDTIQQIFDYNPEEKDELKTLIVYDEAHRVLPKFGGTGEGVKKLERGAREFRKWGTGMLMISQVIDDFPEEVRANIGTQIQMRTEYEGDLDRIERKYGNNITQGVTKADTGTGMVQNSSYNHGRPYFVDFRPVKHSPERLSDEELDKFEKYNRRVDEIEDMISILENQGEDVFEYKSQLKLVKKNIRKRSFNLVDTYLDELENDLDDAF